MKFNKVYYLCASLICALPLVVHAADSRLYYDKPNLFVGDTHTMIWNVPTATRCENITGINIGTSGSWSFRRTIVGESSSSIFCFSPGSSVPERINTTYYVYEPNDLINKINTEIKIEHNNSSGLASKYDMSNWLYIMQKDWKVIWNSTIKSGQFTYSPNDGNIGDVKNGYNASQWLDGIMDLYKATGDFNYADIALNTVYEYLNSGLPLLTKKEKYVRIIELELGINELRLIKNYKDWYSSSGNGKGYDVNHYHYEWRAAQGIARVVSDIYTNPNLINLKAKAATALDFLVEDFWYKWSEQFTNNTNVTHMMSRGGLTAIYLYKATGDTKYLNAAVTIANKLQISLFNNKKTTSNGLYEFYNITCYLNGNGCSSDNLWVDKSIDVSHAGDTVNFIFESYKNGIIFSSNDIKLLLNTLKYSIFNKDKKAFNSNVCNRDIAGCAETKIPSGFDPDTWRNIGCFQGGWAKLARYDQELIDMYIQWLGFIVQPNKGANGTVTMKKMNNAKLDARNSPVHTKHEKQSPWAMQIKGNLALAIKNRTTL